ncbi:MAG: Competence protein F homolog, phosphoribosyltransferase domain; protein YhgH required for utilization of DNA as sole source of carbon and energy [uncultured Rubrobacteraceae bacterium]|uniref:Competence protein F homolog, phosphoribosyltransferase domain protein YhgH required for utilization of DNA as sole source of carbon and energy n=1 Tax=uncultured Rubrobacteraceae bacterium TaxID=349277 RepID=A0A6J4Q3P5_9ACTN|nr:MAG: Competence protein F homolog, phosphoribosyltransferase domain; protein YhgH required for utilization of DNA as sole source of carbon and energy [uncultured Rubrobacteraceae bacterium]
MYEPYLAALADLFYPQWCVSCERRAGDVLCRPCFESLPWAGSPTCERCGVPTALETPACGACKNVDFAFETARAPLRYEGVGKEVVHALKYRGYTAVVEKLAAPLLAEAVDGPGKFDAVVPVPLHRARLRKRGFNQAALLARGLARRINTPVSDTLEVVRSTRDQVELSAAERRQNVAGAYAAGTRTRGRLLIVDDVFTTGATTSACATALLRAGAAEVHAVTLCRTC